MTRDYRLEISSSEEDIKSIHNRLQSDLKVEIFQRDRFEFIDLYQITWQIAVEPTFRTAGDFANRWIAI
ncbi:MAG: hypothetical protein EDM79_18595 [Chloroflexi bacterium]|nr:MAG: hypothetical protein EDM79_18595 [Chloroflexota bacterium]